MKERFAVSNIPEEAFITGIYKVAYGNQREYRSIRKELETNKTKRSWLKQIAGSGNALMNSLAQGESWRKGIRMMPAINKARDACGTLMGSEDALVRRVGLLWGYFIADAHYWQSVQTLLKTEPAGLTKNFANYLFTEKKPQK